MAEKKANPFEKAPLANAEDTKEAKSASEGVEAAAGSAESTPVDSDTATEANAAAEGASAAEADAPVSEAKPEVATPKQEKPKKLTPTQERDALREEVESLKARLDAREEAKTFGVVEDRVLAEDVTGGTVRYLPESVTVMNDDWRMTRAGLVVMIGRASAQSNTALKIPASLLPSLVELAEHYLAELGETNA